MGMALILLCIVAQTPPEPEPGPLDAFRANVASISAGITYTIDFYPAPPREFLQRLQAHDQGPGPAEEPTHHFEGRWEYDGVNEHTVVRAPEEKAKNLLKDGSKNKPLKLILVDLINNDQMIAFHRFPKDPILHVAETDSGRLPVPLINPFTWHHFYRFDKELDDAMKQASVEYEMSTRANHPVEVEIYKTNDSGQESRREIWFDLNRSYIPIFYRSIAIGDGKVDSSASVREMYLIDTKACANGGVIPTEWYIHTYTIDQFRSNVPEYTHRTTLTPSQSIAFIHCKASNLFDLKKPVTFDDLKAVDRIFAPGGQVPLKNAPNNLTLEDVRQRVTKAMKPTNQSLMGSIDQAELQGFDSSTSKSYRPLYLLCAVACFLLAGTLVVKKRGSSLLIFVGLLPFVAGCGSQPAVPRLLASFNPSRILYEPASDGLRLSLELKNAGNVPLQLFSVDSGCSCRNVDHSVFPTRIAPGDCLRLSVKFTAHREYVEQSVTFSFATDLGKLQAAAAIYPMATHMLSPSSVSLRGLYEGEANPSFEFVHRRIFKCGERGPEVRLVAPKGITVKEVASKKGTVYASPNYSYEDTTYHGLLNDNTIGLHKELLQLQDTTGRRVTEVPVVWQRFSYLSTNPSRVVLSTLPVRTFLRCPDDSVEFTRVLSSPNGVRAVLAGPREVLVSPTPDVKHGINGYVEVETSAKDRRALRIPVARYSNTLSSTMAP